ncbi:phage head closure protein [Rhizobium sp. RU36D]|uniref:phage head closure protein n=1 Tax=Rhizobium sp. RU36D TaxID=1907415 RepID=UPI0009D8179F|nr:phage head closure protein [Rhizobium sp. RU36D]SMD10835.1 phage head-tail adaptor, putative, SPP1 family [Rhizobium sp. RU36D]
MVTPNVSIGVIDAGAMTARLSLERPVTASDGQGGAGISYEAVADLWVRVEPVSVTLEERAGGEVFSISHRVWLNFRRDIEAGMRFRRGIRRLVVKSWRDPDETGRYLVCDCVEERR